MNYPQTLKALHAGKADGSLELVQRLCPCLTRMGDIYLQQIIAQPNRQRFIAFGAGQRVKRKVYSAIDVRTHNAAMPRLK